MFAIQSLSADAASLVDTSSNEVLICAEGLETRDDLEFEVEFETDTKPVSNVLSNTATDLPTIVSLFFTYLYLAN